MTMNTQKTHIIIPARLKSTRLPSKPLLTIHGKPMILWTANKAAQTVADGIADDYHVATDDESIFQLCKTHDIPVVMTSPDHASGTDRLAEVVKLLQFHDDDIIINMQGDEPMIPPSLLSQVKELLIHRHDCAMSTLCEVIDNAEDFYKPSVVKVVKSIHNHALYFSRAPIPHDRSRTDTTVAPSNAYRHLGLYAYKVSLLKNFSTWPMGTLEELESLEQLRVLEQGYRIAIDVATISLPLGVDTQSDLDRLNAMPIDQLL